MNLSNFKQFVSPVIQARGENYYQNQQVKTITPLKNGRWVAIVEGNYDDYVVEIELDNNNEILQHHCNCPFDGPICKHVVAVLLSLEVEITAPVESSSKKQDPPTWRQIIETTNEQELRDFLVEYAARNQDFQNQLQIHFSTQENQDNTAYYENLVADIFNNYEYQGYIDYHNSHHAMNDIYQLLAKADEYLKKSLFQEAFSISAAVAPQCIKALQEMDDSSGDCSGAINDAFSNVDTILTHSNNTTLCNQVFDWLYEQMQNSDYDDYGCEDTMESVFFKHATTGKYLEIAFELIELQLAANADFNNWGQKHRHIKYLKYKQQLLRKSGNSEQAQKLIDDNLRFKEFREMRVKQLQAVKHYDQAIKLIHEGISIEQKENSPGYVIPWKERLLDIYQTTQNNSDLMKTSKELFINHPNSIKYFKLYKSTITKEAWPQALEELLSYLKSKGNNQYRKSFSYNLAQVYIEEKMWSSLLEIVSNDGSISEISQYTKHLKKDFSLQLIQLYKKGIQELAQDPGRNIYKQLVSYLKEMAALQDGKPEAQKLKNHLLETYKKRRAMKEEFNILRWD
ncbi:hypothetical protein DMA11_12950 [Marinilabiliaceae bacterium JC017]|nr:hypothetical protein DMA11_12950 [Marinilabiliaceae bacterium JC017]